MEINKLHSPNKTRKSPHKQESGTNKKLLKNKKNSPKFKWNSPKKHTDIVNDRDKFERILFGNTQDLFQSHPAVSTEAKKSALSSQLRETPDISKQDETDEEPPKMCYQHYKDHCHKDDCQLLHYLRLPKIAEICKYYMKHIPCPENTTCRYMHSEFPCKFHHLGIQHPKLANGAECRFSHDTNLTDEMTNVLQNYLEKKESLQCGLRRTDEITLRLIRTRNEQLEKEIKVVPETTNLKITPKTVSLELNHILTQKQIDELSRDGFKSIDQMVALSISQLKNYNLSTDQIYQMHLKTVREGVSKQDSKPLEAPQNQTEELEVTTNTNDSSGIGNRSVDEEADFYGFAIVANLVDDIIDEKKNLKEEILFDTEIDFDEVCDDDSMDSDGGNSLVINENE